MGEKADVFVDVSTLSKVDPAVLAGLRVGQRLNLAGLEEAPIPTLITELGTQLAPLADAQLSAKFPNPKVIIRAIKREAGTGLIQQLQVRLYRSDDAGNPGTCGSGGGGAGPGVQPAAQVPGEAQAPDSTNQEHEYKLRRAQYQALADSAELKEILSDPRLQAVLSQVDGAHDRERALAAQLENSDFQGFVSEVLRSLDPDRVPATSATVAAVAMASK